MFPIVYDANFEADYIAGNTPTKLCIVSDCLTCKITEGLDHTYDLEMSVPASSAAYPHLVEDNYVVIHWRVPESTNPVSTKDRRYFYIYDTQVGMDNRLIVKAHHVSERMRFIIEERRTGASTPIRYGQNPFGNIPIWDGISSPYIPTHNVPVPLRDTLWGMEGSIADRTHYEFYFEGYDVICTTRRGENRGVHVRYGRDMVDFKQEKHLSSLITGIVPYYYKDENGVVEYVSLGGYLPSAYDYLYGFSRIEAIDATQDFSSAPTQAQLSSWGTNYWSSHDDGLPKVSISVKFSPIQQAIKDDILKKYGYYDAAELNLGDTVYVDFDRLGISVEARIVKVVFDCLREKYDEIEIGNVKPKLHKTLAKVIRKTGVGIYDA